MKIPIVNTEPMTLRNKAEEARASSTWYWTASTITIGITGMAVGSTASGTMGAP
jgi:hypothetical protein